MSRHPSTIASPGVLTGSLVIPSEPIEADGIAVANAMLRSFHTSFSAFGDHTCNLSMQDDRFSRHCLLTNDYTRSTAITLMERLNDTFDRICYTMDNPDAALTYVDDVPTLVATDASGIDHETLFKLGCS